MIDKKWIVIGAAGFIGNEVYKYLLNAKCNVIGIDRNPEKLKFSNKILKINTNNIEQLKDKCDSNTTILHFGESANVEESFKNPKIYLEESFYSNIKILELIRKTNAILIYPSSGSIFSRTNQMPLIENSVVGPSSPYAAGKLNGESMCMSYRESYNLDIRIVRIFSVYGPSMSRFFIFDAIKKIYESSEKVIFSGSGKQVRDYLFMSDLIKSIITISDSENKSNDFNVASGIPTRIADLAEIIKKIMNKHDLKIEFDNAYQPYQKDIFYANIEKINSINIYPEVTLNEGLSLTIPSVITKITQKK
jgi:UDP-glucose 4-epimerase